MWPGCNGPSLTAYKRKGRRLRLISRFGEDEVLSDWEPSSLLLCHCSLRFLGQSPLLRGKPECFREMLHYVRAWVCGRLCWVCCQLAGYNLATVVIILIIGIDSPIFHLSVFPTWFPSLSSGCASLFVLCTWSWFIRPVSATCWKRVFAGLMLSLSLFDLLHSSVQGPRGPTLVSHA